MKKHRHCYHEIPMERVLGKEENHGEWTRRYYRQYNRKCHVCKKKIWRPHSPEMEDNSPTNPTVTESARGYGLPRYSDMPKELEKLTKSVDGDILSTYRKCNICAETKWNGIVWWIEHYKTDHPFEYDVIQRSRKL